MVCEMAAILSRGDELNIINSAAKNADVLDSVFGRFTGKFCAVNLYFFYLMCAI